MSQRTASTDNRLTLPFPASPQLSCIELFLNWLYVPHFTLGVLVLIPYMTCDLWHWRLIIFIVSGFALTCGRWALSNWDMHTVQCCPWMRCLCLYNYKLALSDQRFWTQSLKLCMYRFFLKEITKKMCEMYDPNINYIRHLANKFLNCIFAYCFEGQM